MYNRRNAIGVIAVMAACAKEAIAHTPYGLWDAFRKQNLQILTSHEDYTGDDLAEIWVATLRKELPLSRAMVSRARNFSRVASLLKTDQSKLAVLSHKQARDMFSGAPPFELFAPMPIQVLLDDGKYFLIARESLPKSHAFVITAALMHESRDLKFLKPTKATYGIPLHSGSQAYFSGEEVPLDAVDEK